MGCSEWDISIQHQAADFRSPQCNCLGDDITGAIEFLESWSLGGFGFSEIVLEIKEMENPLKFTASHKFKCTR